MNVLNNIPASYNIGDSLDFINQNFEIIDDYITNFNAIRSNIRQTVVDSIYLDSLSALKISELETLSNTLSPIISLVQNNKRNWIKPFSVFYPRPLSETWIVSYNDIADWLNTNYPVYNTSTGYLFTPEQQAIVYCVVNQTDQVLRESVTLKDSTTCDASVVKVCGQCSLQYYSTIEGTTNCSDFSSTCSECQEVDCYYSGNPYTQSASVKSKIVEGSIAATLNLNFTNTRENNIIGLRYIVNEFNSWSYSNNLT
jgi:hypothetical protein